MVMIKTTHNQMKITKNTHNLFCKHGSELLWVSGPMREPRPKGTNEKTDEAFNVLADLDENMELFLTISIVKK